jgi:hypothetical protein
VASENDTSRETANDDDTSWEAANDDTSVQRMDKGTAVGKAEMATTKAAEVSESATKVSSAEMSAAVTTPNRRYLQGARDIDSRKNRRTHFDFRER